MAMAMAMATDPAKLRAKSQRRALLTRRVGALT
jgi:hypothetical protein